MSGQFLRGRFGRSYADPVRLQWPLTGRAEEIRFVEAGLSIRGVSGVVIHGAAGVGKSRVAREALELAASRGFQCRWAVGTSAARSLPLGTFSPWVPPAGSDSLQLVRDVIGSLTSAPEGVEVVIGIDDAHLLDDLSTFVLHQIVQRGLAKVMLTVRDGESIPPAVQEVWHAAPFERLDLQPLSQEDMTSLLMAAIGQAVDRHAARQLWELTRGNVLYLRNIVDQGVADGKLGVRQGYWRWTGDPVVPPSLVEFIESRIGALTGSVCNVVDTLAVAEPLPLRSLARITDHDGIEEADVRGLITLHEQDGEVEVRLAHPLYGEVRRRRAPSLRLRRLRGVVAAELGASDGDDTRSVVRRAALTLDSDLRADAELLTKAAHGAVWLVDLPLAGRLARTAISAGAGPEAMLIRAYVLSSFSRGEDAEAMYTAIPVGQMTDGERANVAFHRATNRFFTLADPAEAKALIDSFPDARSQQAQSFLQAFLTLYWALMGRPELARMSAKAIIWSELTDLVAVRSAVWGITVASGDAGNPSEAAATADASPPPQARGFDAAQMRFLVADAHVGALLLAGRVAAAADVAKGLARRAADFPAAREVHSDPVAGRAALGAGRLDAACDLLGGAADMLSAFGDANGWAYRCQIPRTMALAMRGLTDEALAALDRLEKRRHPGWQYLDYEHALARAWVAACQGAISEAITTALSAAEESRANGQFAAEVMCLQTAVQFGEHSTESRLRELEPVVEGPRVRLAARFAAALHTEDGAELSALSADFDQMGDRIAAVDAAAHAAIAYRRRELRGSALGCATRAQLLAEQCGGADTPALRTAAEPLPLTDREREIAMLLSEGLSVRKVAERLTVSVRTVEGHIYRAMTKTGTSTREELIALVHPRRAGSRP
jgi:DNA-binding CsgD family transcriptional regulator